MAQRKSNFKFRNEHQNQLAKDWAAAGLSK